MRYSEFSAYKLHICRWRNKCDQVLLRQLVLGLIGAVQNLSPSAVHNLSAKMAPSQKHICHYSVGAGEGAMLQSRICHDGGEGEVLQYFHLLLSYHPLIKLEAKQFIKVSEDIYFPISGPLLDDQSSTGHGQLSLG